MVMAVREKAASGSARDRFFVALDVDTLDDARRLMDELVGLVTHVKLGLQLATRESWAEGIAAAHDRGLKVFCDAKFKDIPNTVEHAAYSLTCHKPDYFTIMADNSVEALRAARNGVDRAVAETGRDNKPKIIGVTVLTSINPDECLQIYGGEVKAKTELFGTNAVQAGIDAIVCSPEELPIFRPNKTFDNTIIITPGVRPSWGSANDQSRTATPGQAIRAGADMLVIGRPVTQPPSNVGSIKEAVRRIVDEIDDELSRADADI